MRLAVASKTPLKSAPPITMLHQLGRDDGFVEGILLSGPNTAVSSKIITVMGNDDPLEVFPSHYVELIGSVAP
jgi:hypothetical protein